MARDDAFLREIDKILDEAPMGPTEIERPGKPSAIILSDTLYARLLERSRFGLDDAEPMDDPYAELDEILRS